MSHLKLAILCFGTLLCASPVTAQAAVPLGTNTVVKFASRQTGSEILATNDAYTSRMSQFDRMLRLKSTSHVSQEEYLEYMASHALAWTDADQSRLKPLLQRLSRALDGYRLPLPSTILLIKTTGKEEVGQGHTRANAIVLPLHSLADDDESLFFLLAHELFHVMSRHDKDFRRAAYELVGFRLGAELKLPPEIAPLQITNPDAPRHDSFIDVHTGGKAITVVPVLLSRSAVFDPEIGNILDRYWTLRLLAVETGSRVTEPVAQMQNGAPVLFRLNEVQGFIDQLGRNTRYIIHAEEVLAENFAFLVTGEEVREPRRVEALRKLLAADKDSGMSPAQ